MGRFKHHTMETLKTVYFSTSTNRFYLVIDGVNLQISNLQALIFVRMKDYILQESKK